MNRSNSFIYVHFCFCFFLKRNYGSRCLKKMPGKINGNTPVSWTPKVCLYHITYIICYISYICHKLYDISYMGLLNQNKFIQLTCVDCISVSACPWRAYSKLLSAASNWSILTWKRFLTDNPFEARVFSSHFGPFLKGSENPIGPEWSEFGLVHKLAGTVRTSMLGLSRLLRLQKFLNSPEHSQHEILIMFFNAKSWVDLDRRSFLYFTENL